MISPGKVMRRNGESGGAEFMSEKGGRAHEAPPKRRFQKSHVLGWMPNESVPADSSSEDNRDGCSCRAEPSGIFLRARRLG